MLSSGQEIILFVILLILGLIYLNKYFSKHKVVINKFVFTVSILHTIAIIFLQESNKSNISTSSNPVIWALYIVAILFYKIVKDEEYDSIYFSLFLGVNILCINTLDMLSGIIHLLFLDKELIIKNIFIIIGSGLISGFLYTFFKKCNFRKYEETINMFIFSISLIQSIFIYFIGISFLLSLIFFIIYVIYFINDKENKFGYFLLYLLGSLINNAVFIGFYAIILYVYKSSSAILHFLLVIAIALVESFLYQFFKKMSMK
ncbi:hypothetical protein [Fusobacterium sp.]|uniref:hypothetical protein n=1 Tax=Fusobacterium sp. TaxID=68766 RepID=UPI002902A419|nr:hypothetical protein [Fusobacterium sp.]MDU1911571.1 hypothetical protein [Fusobacterium sp.]